MQPFISNLYPFRSSSVEGEEFQDAQRRPNQVDYSRLRLTRVSRRRIGRGKKPTSAAGLHKRHNKRWSW